MVQEAMNSASQNFSQFISWLLFYANIFHTSNNINVCTQSVKTLTIAHNNKKVTLNWLHLFEVLNLVLWAVWVFQCDWPPFWEHEKKIDVKFRQANSYSKANLMIGISEMRSLHDIILKCYPPAIRTKSICWSKEKSIFFFVENKPIQMKKIKLQIKHDNL